MGSWNREEESFRRASVETRPSFEESRVRVTTEISQRQQELDTQNKELEELCKTMAADAEGSDMAVDGTAESPRLLLQELHMMPRSRCVRSGNIDKICTTSVARRKPSAKNARDIFQRRTKRA